MDILQRGKQHSNSSQERVTDGKKEKTQTEQKQREPENRHKEKQRQRTTWPKCVLPRDKNMKPDGRLRN
jgi:hypothetical protein